jgi:hypothetical protein
MVEEYGERIGNFPLTAGEQRGITIHDDERGIMSQWRKMLGREANRNKED